MYEVLFAGSAVLVLLAVIPAGRRFLRGFVGLAGAKLNTAAEAIGGVDPVGQLKAKIEDAVDSGRKATGVLVSSAAEIKSLKSSIEKDEVEQRRLTDRIKVALTSGDVNKTANIYAIQLEEVESRLVKRREGLVSAQAEYDSNLEMVQMYETQVQQARGRARQLEMDLAQSEAEKNLSRLAGNIRAELNSSDVAAAEQKVMDLINKNQGATQVSRDMSASVIAEMKDDDAVRKDRANAILERIRSETVSA